MNTKTHININLSIPPSMHEAVTELAARELMSRSDYFRRALLAQLARDGVKFDAAASHPST
jgi:metal-responsive CopG/Arc/MetJ family transcriptional regulator